MTKTRNAIVNVILPIFMLIFAVYLFMVFISIMTAYFYNIPAWQIGGISFFQNLNIYSLLGLFGFI